MLLSALVTVYNEEQLIESCIGSIIDHVDEVIVVDGSENGKSTDGTEEIVRSFGEKVNYQSGTYKLLDGRWDAAWQRNFGLSLINGEYFMLIDSDEVYDEESIVELRRVIEENREIKVFYHTFIEFFCDVNHIRLADNPVFPVPSAGNTAIYAMELNPWFAYEGENLLSGGTPRIEGMNVTDYAFIPKVVKYHYGWIKEFKRQVERHIRNIRLGGWGDHGYSLMTKGTQAVYSWAINHVMEYPEMSCSRPYVGVNPIGIPYSSFDGMEQALREYESQFGKNFWERQR